MGVDMMQGNHFSKLSAFVAVAEHGHFSKAAAPSSHAAGHGRHR
jgi:hypothetical protein